MTQILARARNPHVPLLLALFAQLAACASGAPRCAGGCGAGSPDCLQTDAASSLAKPLHKLMFHGDRARLGWNPDETKLTPAAIASGAFGPLWSSEPFDSITVDAATYPPHAYASPLFVDGVQISGGHFDGQRFGVVIAATTNGFVYAVSTWSDARDSRCVPPGTILWRTRLGQASPVMLLDGGVPLGVLSTPVIDLSASSPRIYAAALDASAGWQVWALDLASGRVVDGWPVTLNDASVSPVNTNGPATFEDSSLTSQRGGLGLSAAGDLLYVPFGAYADTGTGWIVVIDTQSPGVVASFSGAPSSERQANGGMWGAGGVAIDSDGTVYMTTGNGPESQEASPHAWGESLLRWSPRLDLIGTYTPWNFCQLEHIDADLGGSSPMLLPDFDPSATSTPHLIAFGGKQGNVVLVDRDHLPGNTTARQPCGTDPSADTSLLPPDPQPQFGVRGPLNVFGPYSDDYGNRDQAKMRSTPAYFQGKDGSSYLFASGATKAAVDSNTSVPPCLARLRVVTAPGAPAYLAVDAVESTLAFLNPGAPVVTSSGGDGAVAWVLDENATRAASLADPNAPRPILYAVDGATMKPLWSSGGLLHVGGKYSTALVVHGNAYVATDRIQAFGLGAM